MEEQGNISIRRKDRGRLDKEFIEGVLLKATEIYVAFATDGAPHVIPLNFVYMENKIYFHCAKEGYKLDCIKKNPKVGFTTAIDVHIIPEEATTLYKSVVGTGHMIFVEDVQEKGFALDALAQRYGASCQRPASPTDIARTGVLRIDIETLCGKELRPQKAG